MDRAIPESTEDRLLAHMSWVRALATQLVADSTLADDVAQDTWLAARRMPASLATGQGSLRAWLSQVVRNRARRLMRGSRRRARREAAVARPEALASTADIVARGALQRDLVELVMQLDEPYRSALLLRYLDELSTAEVGARLGLTPAAARKRLSRALDQLRERLDRRHGGDRHVWTAALLPLVGTAPHAAVVAGVGAPSLVGALVIHAKLIGAFAAAGLLLWLLLFGVFSPGTGVEDSKAVESPATAFAPVGAAEPAPGSRSTSSAALRTVNAAGRTLQIVDAAGAPFAGAPVFLRGAAGELLHELRSDDQGRAHVEPELVPELRELVIAPAGWVPQRVALPAGSSDAAKPNAAIEVVRLKELARIAGRVTGLPTGRSLRMTWDRLPEGLRGSTADLLGRLAGLGIDEQGLRVDVAPDGGFVCEGLALEWSGSLVAPVGTRIVLGARQDHVQDGVELLLLSPRTDIVLELVSLALVRGRCVEARSRLPLADLQVSGRLSLVGRRVDERIEGRTTEDGAFVLALPTPVGGWEGTLDLRFVGALVSDIGFRFEGTALAPTGDLGELELDLGRALSFRAEDPEGRPIQGARAHLPGEPSIAVPSGPDGRGRVIGVHASSPRLVVLRDGFAPAEVQVQGDVEACVVLRPHRSLVITVRDAEGAVPAGLAVQVLAEERAWEGPTPTGWLDPEFVRPGEAVLRAQLEAPMPIENGEVALSGLRAGVSLRLRLLNGAREELDARDLTIALVGAESRRVELRAPLVGRRISGRVSDRGGKALPRVRIYAESAGDVQTVFTDADGRFRLGPYSGAIRFTILEVGRPGFRTLVRENLSVGEEQLHFELEPARRIVVLVEDERGAHPEVDLTLTPAQLPYGTSLESARIPSSAGEAAGTYVFEDAPREPVLLRAEYGGITSERLVTAEESEVRLVVPAAAVLEISVAEDLEIARSSMLRVTWQRLEHEVVVASGMRLARRGPDGWDLTHFDLPSGRYRVQLVEWSVVQRRARPIGEPQELEMIAGDRSRIRLPLAR